MSTSIIRLRGTIIAAPQPVRESTQRYHFDQISFQADLPGAPTSEDLYNVSIPTVLMEALQHGQMGVCEFSFVKVANSLHLFAFRGDDGLAACLSPAEVEKFRQRARRASLGAFGLRACVWSLAIYAVINPVALFTAPAAIVAVWFDRKWLKTYQSIVKALSQRYPTLEDAEKEALLYKVSPDHQRSSAETLSVSLLHPIQTWAINKEAQPHSVAHPKTVASE